MIEQWTGPGGGHTLHLLQDAMLRRAHMMGFDVQDNYKKKKQLSLFKD